MSSRRSDRPLFPTVIRSGGGSGTAGPTGATGPGFGLTGPSGDPMQNTIPVYNGDTQYVGYPEFMYSNTSGLQISNTVSLQQIQEKVVTISYNSEITHDWANGSIIYITEITGDFMLNLSPAPPTTNSSAYTISLILPNPGGYCNAVYIGNSSQTILWQNGITPSPSTGTDIETLTLIYTGSQWIVLGNYNTYGS